MRTPLCGVAALVAAACSSPLRNLPPPPPLPVGATGDVVIVSYPVQGRTVERIAESLEANGPVWEGRHAYGLARWRFTWGWRTLQEEDVCRLADVRVAVTVEITMPQWLDWHRSSPELRTHWEDFEAALLQHEYGHRDLGYHAAAEIFHALETAEAPRCADVGPEARARARAIMRRYQSINKRFERDTGWGRTQGATWPPES